MKGIERFFEFFPLTTSEAKTPLSPRHLIVTFLRSFKDLQQTQDVASCRFLSLPLYCREPFPPLAFFARESVHVTCPDACWRGRHAHSASAAERRNGENMNAQKRAEIASI